MVRVQGPQPGGGQFDRQGEPVQAGAQPGHRLPVGVGDVELRLTRRGPLPQQLHGLVRHGQGSDGEDVLAGHAEGLAAGREDAQVRGGREEGVRQFGAGVD
jgi:hypothetical protein